MRDRLKKIVTDALADEPEIRLVVGENDYTIEYGNYSIIINYSIDTNDSYLTDDNIMLQSDYKFRINSVYITDNDSDEDFEIEPDENMEYEMFHDSYIEDWSDELSDENLDDFLTDNF